MKKGFNMKQKAFFIICKGLSNKQIRQIFLESESATLRKYVEHKVTWI